MEIPWELLFLVVAGFFAGVINTLAGGGSLITLPLLIFMGLPSAEANGTNRIALMVQNISGTFGFRSKGISIFPFALYLAVPALIGAIIGANVAVDMDDALFNRLLAIIMVGVVLIMVLKPKAGRGFTSERLTGKYRWFGMLAFLFIGFYGGFIQAGVGFLIILALSSINHLSLVKSNATKLFVVLIYMSGAIVMFILNDKVHWTYGIIMAIGNASGAWIASRWSVRKGDGLVRKFLVVAVIALAIKLWFF